MCGVGSSNFLYEPCRLAYPVVSSRAEVPCRWWSPFSKIIVRHHLVPRYSDPVKGSRLALHLVVVIWIPVLIMPGLLCDLVVEVVLIRCVV